MNITDLHSIVLELALVGLGLLVLMTDAFSRKYDGRQMGHIVALFLCALFVVSFWIEPLSTATFSGMYRLDALSLFLKRFFLGTGVIVALMSADFVGQLKRNVGGYFAILSFALVGMMLCASVNDFALLFVSVELITVSFYVLVSFMRTETASLEAGTKYLVIGALSSGFMVYGIAFIFGTTGATNFQAVSSQLSALNGQVPTALMLGMLLVFVGLGFKVASVPFQIWAPDVYQGAPTPVTAFLAVGSKAAGFVLLMRTFFIAWGPMFESTDGKLPLLIAALAGLTLLYGNLAAIPQRNIKRLLGYSSIGHAGYMLMGLAAANVLGAQAVLYYLAAYLFTNLCAFMVIVVFFNATGSDQIPSYAGLAKRSPLLAVAMLMALFSLAGIPPLAGFFGKFLIFTAVIQAASAHPHLYVLAFIGIAMAVVSLFFYLGIVRAIYIQEPEDASPIQTTLAMRVGLYTLMGGILVLGIYQKPILNAAEVAVAVFAKLH